MDIKRDDEFCRSDHHLSEERILAELGIEPVTSCSQVLYVTDWGRELGPLITGEASSGLGKEVLCAVLNKGDLQRAWNPAILAVILHVFVFKRLLLLCISWLINWLINWLIDYMVCNPVLNFISVISRWPVHLSMLSRRSFNQYYSFQVTGCFPNWPLSTQWRALR